MTVCASLELREAEPGDILVLRRLMQLYLYELGTLDGWDIGADGLYGDALRIEGLWTEPERRSFLVRVDAALAGFALVRRGTRFAGPEAHEISEFFILARYRRRGIGAEVARRLFDRFPGRWEVAQLASNTPAQAFWRVVIGRYTDGRFEDRERSLGTWRGRVQHFTAGTIQ
jgi:predicted acetyltransferase